MLLHNLRLNLRNREARRDLADPYELHSTLCRAFFPPTEKCPPGAFLWRLEISNSLNCYSQVLVQSSLPADWNRIGVKDWLISPPKFPLDLVSKLSLDGLQEGFYFRFRLRANPCVFRGGKRQALFHYEDQKKWLVRKGVLHGFELLRFSSRDSGESDLIEPLDVVISQEQHLWSKKREGHEICIFSVLFDGILVVTDVEKFRHALQTGIGHGKMMGLGLLSVMPLK